MLLLVVQALTIIGVVLLGVLVEDNVVAHHLHSSIVTRTGCGAVLSHSSVYLFNMTAAPV